MNLNERFAHTLAEAKTALESGELEKGQELRKQAETLKAAIGELDALDAMRPQKAQPVRPPMPTGDDNKAMPTPPQPQKAQDPVLNAAYVMRFGDEDASIKAVLTDIHGADHMAQYWAHKAAFNRYLRGGEKAFKPGDATLLRQIVLTPEAVRDALTQGADVATLKATMVEATDTLGGYTVPVDFQAEVVKRLRGLTVMRGRARITQTSRDAAEFVKLTGGNSQYTGAVRVTWVDETPTAGASESNLTFGLERVPVHTAMIETPLSRNLVEDSAVNLESELATAFAEAIAIDEDNQFLTGDGNGRPRGLLPSSGNGLSLTEANSGNASALTWDGLITLAYSIDSQYRQNAAWIAERATWQAVRKLKDGAGQYLWQPSQQAGEPPVLLGFPVLEQEAMPSIASNAYPILFGDLRGYRIVDRVGMTVERYLDSQTARQNLVYYVMRRRLGGQCLETWRFAVQKVSG